MSREHKCLTGVFIALSRANLRDSLSLPVVDIYRAERINFFVDSCVLELGRHLFLRHRLIDINRVKFPHVTFVCLVNFIQPIFVHVDRVFSLQQLGIEHIISDVLVLKVEHNNDFTFSPRATKDITCDFFYYLKDYKIRYNKENTTKIRVKSLGSWRHTGNRKTKKKKSLKIVGDKKEKKKERKNAGKTHSAGDFQQVVASIFRDFMQKHSKERKMTTKISSHEGVFEAVAVVAWAFIIARVLVLVRFGEACGTWIKSLVLVTSFAPAWLLFVHRCRRHAALAKIS